MPDKKLSQKKLLYQISFHPTKRGALFSSLSEAERSSLLLKLSSRVQAELLKNLSDEAVVATIEHLDPDEIVDMLRLIPEKRRSTITKALTQALQQEVTVLSKFDPQTAAGLMTMDYIQVDVADTVTDVAQQLKTHEHRTGRVPVIIVMNKGVAAGYLPIHVLATASPKENIEGYVRKLLTINHDQSHQAVLKLFKENPHSKMAVIGRNGNVLGVIFSDDVLEVLEDHQTASLYSFAGVSHEESVTDSVKTKVTARYKWLMINLCTAFLAASVVGLFISASGNLAQLGARVGRGAPKPVLCGDEWHTSGAGMLLP